MLAPEPMLEANLFVLEPDVEAVTAALARLEALHLEEIQPEDWAPSGEWAELSSRYARRIQRALAASSLGVNDGGKWCVTYANAWLSSSRSTSGGTSMF